MVRYIRGMLYVVSDFNWQSKAEVEYVQLVLQIIKATQARMIKLCIPSHIVVQFHYVSC